jgi:hypothetical protein
VGNGAASPPAPPSKGPSPPAAAILPVASEPPDPADPPEELLVAPAPADPPEPVPEEPSGPLPEDPPQAKRRVATAVNAETFNNVFIVFLLYWCVPGSGAFEEMRTEERPSRIGTVDPKVKRRGAHDAGLFCALMMGLSSLDGEAVAERARCEALPLIFFDHVGSRPKGSTPGRLPPWRPLEDAGLRSGEGIVEDPATEATGAAAGPHAVHLDRYGDIRPPRATPKTQ